MAVIVKQGLQGNVAGKAGLVGTVVNNAELSGTMAISTSGVTEQYEGDYEVTPLVTAQTLETKKKVMKENLTIKEIPFFETSNNSGGSTVYIAKEI